MATSETSHRASSRPGAPPVAVTPEVDRDKTPVGKRRCAGCRTRLADQAVYFPANYYSNALCSDCATELTYQRMLHFHERFRGIQGFPEPPTREEWLADWLGLPTTRPCEVCGHELAWLGYRRAKIRVCSWECNSERINRPRRIPKVERPCIVCGQTFTPKRPDGKTCSARCRKSLSRMDEADRAAAEKRNELWEASRNTGWRARRTNSCDEEQEPEDSPQEQFDDHMGMLHYYLKGAIRQTEDAADVVELVETVKCGPRDVDAEDVIERLAKVRDELCVAMAQFWKVTDDRGSGAIAREA
jgi:predicted nucleic acid-binding Zn ribbon protein